MLFIEANVVVKKVLEEQMRQLMKDVGAREVNFKKQATVDAQKSEEFDGDAVWVGVGR